MAPYASWGGRAGARASGPEARQERQPTVRVGVATLRILAVRWALYFMPGRDPRQGRAHELRRLRGDARGQREVQVEERRRGSACHRSAVRRQASAFSHFTKRGVIAATPATPSAAACRASRSASSNASQPTWTMTRSPWRAPLAAQASASRSRSPTLSDMLSPDVPQTKTPTQPSRRRCAAYLSTFFVDAALGGVEFGHDSGPLARERLGVAVCICGVVVEQQRRRPPRPRGTLPLLAARMHAVPKRTQRSRCTACRAASRRDAAV